MNKVAIVTGASRGLGAVLARFLAQQEWHVIIDARSAVALKAVADGIPKSAGTVIAITGDVSRKAHRVRLVQAAKELGRLDLLVNNASTLGPTPLPKLSDVPGEAIEETMAVNLLAPIALVQGALPLLKAGGGLVVNVSSDAALGGYEGWGVYGMSKAALDLASLTMANELKVDGVGVVSVDPGDMRTQMHQDAYPGEDISDRPLPEVTLPFWAWLLGQEPMRVTGGRYKAQAETWELPKV